MLGDWHGFPLRVRARHFDPRGKGDCTGLFLHFLSGVPPFCLHGSNDRLSAVIDGHVGDGEPLLSTRSVSLQRLIFFCLDCRLEVSLRCPRSSVFLGNHRPADTAALLANVSFQHWQHEVGPAQTKCIVKILL